MQPSTQVSSIQYTQPQQVQVKFQPPQQQVHVQEVHQQVEYKAPEIKTKIYSQPAHAHVPAPAPVVKQYNVHENQVPTWAIIRSNLDDNFDGNFQYE